MRCNDSLVSPSDCKRNCGEFIGEGRTFDEMIERLAWIDRLQIIKWNGFRVSDCVVISCKATDVTVKEWYLKKRTQ